MTISRRSKGGIRKTVSFIFALILAGFFLFLEDSSAIESICPGGSSPRGDIDWCVDFHDLSRCTTGQETNCVTDSGLSSLNVNSSKDFKILSCLSQGVLSPISTSTGCISGSGWHGGSGPGYSNKTFTGVTSNCLRWYVYFDNGWLQNYSTTGDHGPALIYGNGLGTCDGKLSIDFANTGMRVIHQNGNVSACTGTAPTDYDINTNVTDWKPKNKHWYLNEMCSTMNTTASSSTAGDGTLTFKVDGVSMINRTDLNIRGTTVATKFNDSYLARNSLGFNVPPWEPVIHYAAFAHSNNGTQIGASPDEVSANLGTGDTSSPYFYGMAYDGLEQQKLSQDCSASGSFSKDITTGWDDVWGTTATFSTTQAHTSYTCDLTGCPSCTNTKSLRAETTGASTGSGIVHLTSNLSSTNASVIVLHNWMYLPTLNSVGGSNDYTANTKLTGMYRYCAGAGGGNDRCWFGLMRKSGKICIGIGTDNVAGTDICSTTDWPLDGWHEFQIAIGSDNKAYVQYDGTWIIDGTTPSQAIGTWAFDTVGAGGTQNPVFGIGRDSPATRFTIYVDDRDGPLGASANDMKFWGTSSPFTAPSTGSTTGGNSFLLLRRKTS